jgi:polar amino acid transport system substrate-binding protein
MLVQSQAGHALFNVNRTPSRDGLVKWVGPLQTSITHLYENRRAPTGVTTLEEAKNVKSICVLRGNIHHRYLEKEGFENLFPANSYASCVQMLINQRADLTPLSNISAPALSSQPQEEKVLQETPVKLSESEGYLAFSPDTSDEVITTWQDALDQLKATGRYQELFNLYLKPE